MTGHSARWERVQDLCVAALDCDPADRDSFLTTACGGDLDLRQEIDSLLAQEGGAERFLTTSALGRYAGALVPDAIVSQVGQAFGPYEIQGFIGSGGMGEVYRARDQRLHRDVAIKVLPAALSGDADRLQRFEQEARATAALSHPNILAVYDIGTHDGQPFIVSELLTGETLAERLTRGPLEVIDAVDVAIQLAQALAAAHEIGIVHRDLKPANIFITRQLQTKVLDFGLAKMREPRSPTPSPAPLPRDAPTTRPGVGTLAYMSPEQVMGSPVDPRLDVWSLGVVLYEMVTGQRPFRGEGRQAVAAAIASTTPDPASHVRAGLPADLDRVLNRALAKNPGDRPDATELIADLQRVRLTLSQTSAWRLGDIQRLLGPAAVVPGRISGAALGLSITAVVFAAILRGLELSKVKSLSARVALGALALAVVALSTLAWTLGRVHGSQAQPLTTRQIMLSDSSEGAITAAAISPDGSTLAYAMPSAVYVQDADTGLRLFTWKPPADVTALAFLRDGRDFLAVANQRLWRVTGEGRDALALLDRVDKVAVSPDGQRLALLRDSNSIWTSDTEGRHPAMVKGPQPRTQLTKPSWSPDGRALALRVVKPVGEKGLQEEITVVDIASRIERSAFIVPQGSGLHQVLWAPDGRLLFTMPGPRGRYTNLFMIPVIHDGSGTAVPVPLTDWPDFNFNSPTITEDGRRLIFVRMQWKWELQTASLEQADALRDRTWSVRMGGQLSVLDWTPDGSLLFRSDAKAAGLFRQRSNALASEQVWRAPRGGIEDASMTADGRWLFVATTLNDDSCAVYRVAAASGSTEQVFAMPSNPLPAVRCAHQDAHTCIMASRIEKKISFWRLDPDSGTTRPFTTLGPVLSNTAWDISPDGTRLAVVIADATHPRIAVISMADGSSQEVDVPSSLSSIAWLADGSGWIVSEHRGEQGTDILRVRPPAAPVTLWSSGSEALLGPRVSVDGHRVAFVSWRLESQIWMLRGF